MPVCPLPFNLSVRDKGKNSAGMTCSVEHRSLRAAEERVCPWCTGESPPVNRALMVDACDTSTIGSASAHGEQGQSLSEAMPQGYVESGLLVGGTIRVPSLDTVEAPQLPQLLRGMSRRATAGHLHASNGSSLMHQPHAALHRSLRGACKLRVYRFSGSCNSRVSLRRHSGRPATTFPNFLQSLTLQ